MGEYSTLLCDIRDVGESIVSTAQDIQLLLENNEDVNEANRTFKYKHASTLAVNILSLLSYLKALDYDSIDRQDELVEEVRKVEFSSFGLKSIFLSLSSSFIKYRSHQKKIYNFLNVINVSANRIITISLVAKQISHCEQSSNVCNKNYDNFCYSSKDTCEIDCYDGVCYEDQCSKEIEDLSKCPEYKETFTESPHVHVENGFDKKERFRNFQRVPENEVYTERDKVRATEEYVSNTDAFTDNICKEDFTDETKGDKTLSQETYKEPQQAEALFQERSGLEFNDRPATKGTVNVTLNLPIEYNSFNHITGVNSVHQMGNNEQETKLNTHLLAGNFYLSKLDRTAKGNAILKYLLQLIRKHQNDVQSSNPNMCTSSNSNDPITNVKLKHDNKDIPTQNILGSINSNIFHNYIVSSRVNHIRNILKLTDQSTESKYQTSQELPVDISYEQRINNKIPPRFSETLTKTSLGGNTKAKTNAVTSGSKSENHAFKAHSSRIVDATTALTDELSESSQLPSEPHSIAYIEYETTFIDNEVEKENKEAITKVNYILNSTEEIILQSATTMESHYESFSIEENAESSDERNIAIPEIATESYYASFTSHESPNDDSNGSPETESPINYDFCATDNNAESSYETTNATPEITSDSCILHTTGETTPPNYDCFGYHEITTQSYYNSYSTEENTGSNYETTSDNFETTTQLYYETTTIPYETTTQDLYKVSQDIYSVAQDLSTKANEISSMTSDISSKVSDISSMVSDLSSYDNEELSKKVQGVSKLTQEINSKTSEISSLSSTTSSLASDISSASSDMTTAERNHPFRTSPWQKMSNKGQDMITSTQGMITAAQDILVKIESVVYSTSDMVVADAVASLSYEITAKTQRLISETLNIVSAVIDLMYAIDS